MPTEKLCKERGSSVNSRITSQNSEFGVLVTSGSGENRRLKILATTKWRNSRLGCCAAEKHVPPTPVIVVIAIGILLLLTIIVCVIIETVGARGGLPFWNSRKFGLHSKDDKIYHMNIVAYINRLNTTWKAKYNRFASRAIVGEMSAHEVSMLVEQSKKMSRENLLGDTIQHMKELKKQKVNLPSQFDGRIRWPLCWSIHQVSNQGGCGSCWAMSAASVMSDRVCIASNSKRQDQISAQDLVSCCTECGGCQGSHWALSTFIYWKYHGIVTGGDYGSFEGCRPYAVKPDCGGPCSFEYYQKKVTPYCDRTCHPLYDRDYREDIIRSKKAYWIRAEKGGSEITPMVQTIVRSAIGKDDPTELIKRELFLYGPILSCFSIREDFQHYSSGIYQSASYKDSKELYGHCAKLLGWGEQDGNRYWLYMNTWGRGWGDAGFFRVSMNELPEEAVAGLLDR